MQNLEKSTFSNNITEKYLLNLLNQLLKIEQNTKEEKKQLAQWEEEKEFSILGIIELFTNEIRGYAFQIISNKIEQKQAQIISNLQQLNFFSIIFFNEWYFSNKLNYPMLKNYVEKINYLRLLILEYLIEISLKNNG